MATLPNMGEAAQAAYDAEARLSEISAARKAAKEEKDRTRAVLDALLEESGQRGASVGLEDGKVVSYYYKDKSYFDPHNEEEVMEWAKGEDENYIDPTPSVRWDLVYGECRRREEEGLPLPPGIVKRSDKVLCKRTT